VAECKILSQGLHERVFHSGAGTVGKHHANLGAVGMAK
jgi:hypothetical protein